MSSARVSASATARARVGVRVRRSLLDDPKRTRASRISAKRVFSEGQIDLSFLRFIPWAVCLNTYGNMPLLFRSVPLASNETPEGTVFRVPFWGGLGGVRPEVRFDLRNLAPPSHYTLQNAVILWTLRPPIEGGGELGERVYPCTWVCARKTRTPTQELGNNIKYI